MKKKRSFRKFLIFCLLTGFVFATVVFSVLFVKYKSDFFANIFLSLTITPSSVVPGDDDDTEHVGGGNGGVIIRVKIPAPVDVPSLDDSLSGVPLSGDPSLDSDKVLTNFIDEVNGISVAEQSEVDGGDGSLDLILSVPVLPAMKISDVSIPESPVEDFDVRDVGSRVSFSGVADPYSYILLEVSSRPNIVTLFTDKDGKWSYDLPYDLEDGLHHMYVWSFSKDGSVKALIASRAFFVKSEVKRGSVSEIFVESGSLKAAITNSFLISSLQNEEKGGQMFYVNGRVLNNLEKLTGKEKLSFIVFVKPLFSEFKNIDSVSLEFTYRIYDEDGVLIDTIVEDAGREIENGSLFFTRSFDFVSDKKMKVGDYKLMVEIKSQEFNYWLPLSFEIVEEGAVGFIDTYLVVLMVSVFVVILVAGSFYIGPFVPHLRGRGK